MDIKTDNIIITNRIDFSSDAELDRVLQNERNTNNSDESESLESNCESLESNCESIESNCESLESNKSSDVVGIENEFPLVLHNLQECNQFILKHRNHFEELLQLNNNATNEETQKLTKQLKIDKIILIYCWKKYRYFTKKHKMFAKQI